MADNNRDILIDIHERLWWVAAFLFCIMLNTCSNDHIDKLEQKISAEETTK